MQAALDRVMQTFTMIVNLTPDEQQSVRAKVTSFLAKKQEASEQELAVEGLRYLRSVRELVRVRE
jgi:Mlc titration factor MtfA (ptsG expression regulator)